MKKTMMTENIDLHNIFVSASNSDAKRITEEIPRNEAKKFGFPRNANTGL
jgi:hypothetical protein